MASAVQAAFAASRAWGRDVILGHVLQAAIRVIARAPVAAANFFKASSHAASTSVPPTELARNLFWAFVSRFAPGFALATKPFAGPFA